MKKLLVITIVCTLLTGCQKEVMSCENGICIDNETKEYIIEEDTKVVIGVENEKIGEQIINLWNIRYPHNKGAVEYIVQESFDGSNFLNLDADLTLIYSSEAAKLDNYLMSFDETISESYQSTISTNFANELNQQGNRFIPMLATGWLFSTNVTMLEDLGVNISDENHDGLVDALDSFEKIHEWTTTLAKPVMYREHEVPRIFNLNFDDENLLSSILTYGDFYPFSSFLANEPGFESESFLLNLNDLKDLGNMEWNHPITNEIIINEEDKYQEYSSWNSELYMRDGNSVFNYVSTDMYYDEYEDLTNQDYWFSPMPTINGHQPLNFAQSVGYVMSSDTQYVTVCNLLMELIRSNRGLQIFANHSNYPLLANYLSEDIEVIFIDDNQKQISYAMMYGFEKSMVAFELDTTVAGWDVFYETDIMETMLDVFYQKIEPEAAQEEIKMKSEEWIDPYYISEEELEAMKEEEKENRE